MAVVHLSLYQDEEKSFALRYSVGQTQCELWSFRAFAKLFPECVFRNIAGERYFVENLRSL